MAAIDFNDSHSSSPRLPFALRLKIWSHCISPQIVSLYIYSKRPRSLDDGTLLTAPRQFPLWEINHETRTFAQRQGLLLLHTAPPPPHLVGLPRDLVPARQILFSSISDILYLHREAGDSETSMASVMPRILSLLNANHPGLVPSIRYLSLDFMNFCVLATASTKVWKSMDTFKSLEIIVVTGERFGNRQVQMMCHMLRLAYGEARAEEKEWKMPGWRFVEWQNLLEDAVMEGKVRDLEGLDPEDFLWP